MKKILSFALLITFTVSLSGCNFMKRDSAALGKAFYESIPANVVAFMHYSKHDALFEKIDEFQTDAMDLIMDESVKAIVEIGFNGAKMEAKEIDSITAIFAVNKLDSGELGDEENFCVAVAIKHSSSTLNALFADVPPDLEVVKKDDVHFIKLSSCDIEVTASTDNFLAFDEKMRSKEQNMMFGINIQSLKTYFEPLLTEIKGEFKNKIVIDAILSEEGGAELAAKLAEKVDKFMAFIEGLNATIILTNMQYYAYNMRYKNEQFQFQSAIRLEDSKYIPLLQDVTEGMIKFSRLYLSESVKINSKMSKNGNWSLSNVTLSNPDMSALLYSPLGQFMLGFVIGFAQVMYEEQMQEYYFEDEEWPEYDEPVLNEDGEWEIDGLIDDGEPQSGKVGN